MDFEVRKCTRRCAASERELQPNEVFYSVLVRDGAELVRRDFAETAWGGPPDDAVGWWKSRMPSAAAKRMKLAPNEVMLALLEEWEAEPGKRHLRYLLALLAVRRRAAQLQDATEADGQECLVIQPPQRDAFLVPVAEPTSEEHADQLQEALVALLYAEEAAG